MGSGVDRNQERDLRLVAGPVVQIIRIGRHLLADLVIEEPDVNGGVIEFDCLLAVDGEAMPFANVLPVPAIEPAAEIEAAPVKDALQLHPRPTAIVEAIAFSDDPTIKADLLGS